MYILLSKKNAVLEIIPDYDLVFPGVPIEDRYPPDFVNALLHVPDDSEIYPNWVYDPNTGAFSEPPDPEPAEPEEPEPAPPSLEERLAALEAENAALTAAIERGMNL